jgi:cell wall-associated NlpC family hydrolase
VRLPRRPGRIVGGRRGRTVTAATVLLLALSGVAVLAAPGASAAPSPTVQQVQRTVDRLGMEAEQATERYNDARISLRSADLRLKAAKERLARQRDDVARARTEMGRLAAETYRRGRLSALDVILGDDPESALAQSGYLPSVGDRQAGTVNRLENGERALARAERAVEVEQDKAERAELRMKLNRNTVTQRLAEAKAQLATLRADQRRELARAQRVTATRGVPDGGGAGMCRVMAERAPSEDARAALRFACNQLGDPYVWAAEGPSSWDCSGLTMRAWQEGGVSLPHSSASQSGYGTRVSVGSLQPGDLVFFHSPISHVGIYLGAGLMVHAPHSGDVVRVAGLWATPSAATRL